jgi:NADPH:quinone reductase
MKSVVITNFGDDLGHVRVSDTLSPLPKPGDLLIKVIAAGVNFVDILYVSTSSIQSIR